MAQTVKNLPAMQETQVWSLGGEDTLEKRMATHSSMLAWRIPRTEEPGGLQSVGSHRVKRDWATNTHSHTKKLSSQCLLGSALGEQWGNLTCLPSTGRHPMQTGALGAEWSLSKVIVEVVLCSPFPEDTLSGLVCSSSPRERARLAKEPQIKLCSQQALCAWVKCMWSEWMFSF